jgi:hypothetical protein
VAKQSWNINRMFRRTTSGVRVRKNASSPGKPEPSVLDDGAEPRQPAPGQRNKARWQAQPCLGRQLVPITSPVQPHSEPKVADGAPSVPTVGAGACHVSALCHSCLEPTPALNHVSSTPGGKAGARMAAVPRAAAAALDSGCQ